MIPKFSKRHFEAIAKVLRDTRFEIDQNKLLGVTEKCNKLVGVSTVEINLRQLFKEDNPKFKTLRFANAASLHQAFKEREMLSEEVR